MMLLFQDMVMKRNGIGLPITMLGILSTTFLYPIGHAAINQTGEKGAKIYCFMRESGNPHEVSWAAAYAAIKRQSNSLFKTSPKHGAVMIIETVVKDPNNYKNCGRFLGDLFRTSDATKINAIIPSKKIPSETKESDRYSY